MSLEPIIQSEVSQKEEVKYILTYIYGFQKDGIDEHIRRVAVDTQRYRENRLEDTVGEGHGGTNRVAWKHIHYHM